MLRATPILASALLALVVFAPLTQVQATTQTINFSKTQTFGHITVAISANITIDTTAETITGTVSVTAVNDTSGQTIFSRTFNVKTSYASTGSTSGASFVLMIPTVGEVLGASCTANASTGASSCLVSKNPDVNHDGMVNILDVATVASSFGTSNPAYDLNNRGVVDMTDLAVVAADFNAPVIW